VLPDFFIGAHAAVAQLPLSTRDPSRSRSHFSGILASRRRPNQPEQRIPRNKASMYGVQIKSMLAQSSGE
jgi:hypothetical protein